MIDKKVYNIHHSDRVKFTHYAVYKYVVNCIADTCEPPTKAQIGEHLGFSDMTAAKYLNDLSNWGFLIVQDRRHRAISIAEKKCDRCGETLIPHPKRVKIELDPMTLRKSFLCQSCIVKKYSEASKLLRKPIE